MGTNDFLEPEQCSSDPGVPSWYKPVYYIAKYSILLVSFYLLLCCAYVTFESELILKFLQQVPLSAPGILLTLGFISGSVLICAFYNYFAKVSQNGFANVMLLLLALAFFLAGIWGIMQIGGDISFNNYETAGWLFIGLLVVSLVAGIAVIRAGVSSVGSKMIIFPIVTLIVIGLMYFILKNSDSKKAFPTLFFCGLAVIYANISFIYDSINNYFKDRIEIED